MVNFNNKMNFGKQKGNNLKYTFPRNSGNEIKTQINKDIFPEVLNQKFQKEQIKKVKRNVHRKTWDQILPPWPSRESIKIVTNKFSKQSVF